MTVEKSKGKPRLTHARLTDMGDGTPSEQPTTRSEQNQNNARNRSSKEATKAPLRAVAGAEVRKALGGRATPEESRIVAQNALVLASDAQREIGVSSPFVSHYAVRYGVNAALAGFYTQAAAEAGFDSELGLVLVDAAHKAEARAERAMVAADAAVKAFAGKQRKSIDLGAAIAEASKPRGTP